MTHPLAHRLAAGAPDWARRPLRAWDRDEFTRREPFITATTWWAADDIELPEIAGTAHPDYAGLSCVELLERGKRMPANLTLAKENPGYYTVPGPKLPTMDYVGYADGPLFIGGDGNHRSAIASCLLPLDYGTHRLGGVEIRCHRYDASAAAAFAELADAIAERRLPLHALASRRLLAREDVPGWSHETFAPVVTLFHPGGHSELLTPQQAAERAAELRRGTWLQRCTRWLQHVLARSAAEQNP